VSLHALTHDCKSILFVWIVRRWIKPFFFLLVFPLNFFSSYFIMVSERFQAEPPVDWVSLFIEWRAPWSNHGSKETCSLTEWRTKYVTSRRTCLKSNQRKLRPNDSWNKEWWEARHLRRKGLSCWEPEGNLFEFLGVFRPLSLTGALSQWWQCGKPPLAMFSP